MLSPIVECAYLAILFSDRYIENVGVLINLHHEALTNSIEASNTDFGMYSSS